MRTYRLRRALGAERLYLDLPPEIVKSLSIDFGDALAISGTLRGAYRKFLKDWKLYKEALYLEKVFVRYRDEVLIREMKDEFVGGGGYLERSQYYGVMYGASRRIAEIGTAEEIMVRLSGEYEAIVMLLNNFYKDNGIERNISLRNFYREPHKAKSEIVKEMRFFRRYINRLLRKNGKEKFLEKLIRIFKKKGQVSVEEDGIILKYGDFQAKVLL